MRSAPAFSASATCSPRRAKSAAKIEGASLTTSSSVFTSVLPLCVNRLILGFENLDELLITAGYLRHRRFPCDLLAAPVDQRIPEAGPTDGKADEARYGRCGRQPFADFPVIFTASQDDAANPVAASTACGGHNLFAVFAPLETFDLPYVRLDASVLQFLDGLRHQLGAQFQIVGLLVSLETFELGLLRRDQQFEHEPAAAFVAVQIFRQALQTYRLASIEFGIAFGVVTNQNLAEGRVKGFDMLPEVFSILEIKLVLSAFFRRARSEVSCRACIAQNRGAKLLVHQNAGLFFRHARVDGGCESVIDDALGGRNFGCLLRAQCTVPSEHLLLEREPRNKGQNIQRLVKAESGHAVSLDFL